MKRRTVLAGLGATAAAGVLGMPSILRAQAPVTLNGAVQFNDDHAFTKALVRFEELVKKYYGKPVNFTLHKNSSLGLEKQYFEYMSQGKAVDYVVVRALDRQRVAFPAAARLAVPLLDGLCPARAGRQSG